MSKETVVGGLRLRPSVPALLRHREMIDEAREMRDRIREAAKDRFDEDCERADSVLAEAMVEARDEGVTWRQVAESAKLSRQQADLLVRQHQERS